MIKLNSLTAYFNKLLKPELYRDSSLNGLQVECVRAPSIRKVAFAVDSGLSIIEKAVKAKSQLLVVHHGLFWGEEMALVGVMAQKLDRLINGGCSLYASHLPLDGNALVGNAFELGRLLKLKKLRSFCEYKGSTIGAQGLLSKPLSMAELEKLLRKHCAQGPYFAFPFGPRSIRKVGIVTGSGALGLNPCANDGLDILISGEPKQEVYHLAKELGINALFGGHYATETFGVRALQRLVQRKFHLETIFIDEPTGV